MFSKAEPSASRNTLQYALPWVGPVRPASGAPCSSPVCSPRTSLSCMGMAWAGQSNLRLSACTVFPAWASGRSATALATQHYCSSEMLRATAELCRRKMAILLVNN